MQSDDDFHMMMESEVAGGQTFPPVSVAFGLYPMIDGQKTRDAGHEVYVDVEHVKIVVPGDRLSLYLQPAQDAHRRRFPKAYAAFKSREAGAPMEGMPITQWAAINRGMALTLKALGIHTVEMLAAVHEGNLGNLGTGARELRAKAIAWVEQAKDSATTLRLAAEKNELLDQIKAMQAQINGLTNQGLPSLAPSAPAAPATPEPIVAAPVAAAAVDAIAAARKPRAKAAA